MAPPPEALIATYCFPFFPDRSWAPEIALYSSFALHSSLPVLESNARKRDIGCADKHQSSGLSQ